MLAEIFRNVRRFISIYLVVGSKLITVEGGDVGIPGRKNGSPEAVWQE